MSRCECKQCKEHDKTVEYDAYQKKYDDALSRIRSAWPCEQPMPTVGQWIEVKARDGTYFPAICIGYAVHYNNVVPTIAYHESHGMGEVETHTLQSSPITEPRGYRFLAGNIFDE